MNISGCICKFCEDIAFDTTIKDLGIRLENEIGSFRGYISRYIHVLEYEMIENGKVNTIVRDHRIFLGCLMKVLRHILNDLDDFYPIFTYNSTL